MKNLIYIIILLLSSCHSYIDFDYNSIESKSVVTGEWVQSYALDDNGVPIFTNSCNVIITSTYDLTNGYTPTFVDSAKVSIIIDGVNRPIDLVYQDTSYVLPKDNEYINTSFSAGTDYHIVVEIGEEVHYAASTLVKPAPVVLSDFQEVNIIGDMTVLMCHASIIDIANEDNYYRYVITVNDKVHTSGIIKDSGQDGEPIPIMSYFQMENEGTDNPNADGLYVKDGDYVNIECYAIDRLAYDYIYWLDVKEMSFINSMKYFDSDCIGYFFATSKSEGGATISESTILPAM